MTANTNSPAFLIAEGATAVAISRGATSAAKLARATTAASIGAFFAAVGKDNFTEISAQVQTAIANIKDAATAQFATNLWSLGRPWFQIQADAAAWLPTLEAAATDTGAGISAAAGAAIAQYTPKG